MRSKLSISILSALFLAVLLSGSASASFMGIFGGNGIKGSGDMETRDFDLNKATAVSIHGAFDLNVRMGDKQEISVTIDDNLWDNFEITVKNGTLVLDWEDDCRPNSDCRIDLVLPRLDEVSVHGACDADIKDYRGDSFSFNVRGAGDLEIDGKVEDLKINISGAGDVDARDLKADHVNVKISGAGNATVYAEKSIKARVSGVGNLSYYGDPEDKNTNVSGIGHISQK
jgi:hypothetical protein